MASTITIAVARSGEALVEELGGQRVHVLERWTNDDVLLVHCSNGHTRGPSMAFAILLDQGWPPDAAFTTITAARPSATVDYAQVALGTHLSQAGATQEEPVHSSTATEPSRTISTTKTPPRGTAGARSKRSNSLLDR